MSDFKKKLSILIVENDGIDIRILEDMLSRSPYGDFLFQTALTLEQAFLVLDRDPVDVVLLDLNLPDSKGIETLRSLTERFPNVPVVVNTGAYQDELGLQAVTCGAQDYLIKGKYKPYGLTKALYYAVQRKKAEDDLHQAVIRLKETQTQLIQAEKLTVVGGVASGVAHEVKNPLATILYGIEYLNTKITSDDEKIELTMRSIKEAALRANNIIKDLLDFSSLSELDRELRDLNELVEHSLNFIRYQCEDSKVKVSKDFGQGLPRVMIDKNRIEQVFVDVVLNALHAMKTGGELKVRTYQICCREAVDNGFQMPDGLFPQETQLVVLEIDDSGVGISPENLVKIFDPFFTTRRAAGGVGLGLSIARTIMRNHGGFIDLMNIDGGGARARIILEAGEDV